MRYLVEIEPKDIESVHKILDDYKSHPLSFDVPVTGLADEQFYCQVLDALRELAARADVLPCVLDALVFASFER